MLRNTPAGFAVRLAATVATIALFAVSGYNTSDPAETSKSRPTTTPRATSSATTPSPKPTPTKSEKNTSPFTGLPETKRKPVLAVKIDNVAQARPHTGLSKADIIYVEPVEAGLGRIMAIFSSRLPSSVGPVRSARESDLEVLHQYGKPAFAYSGANSALLPVIARAPIHDVSPAHASEAYVRGEDRPAPHNLYAKPQTLLADAPGASKARDIGFRFGPPPAGGEEVTSRSVSYGAFEVTFRWSAEKRRWLVSMDGDALRSTDGRPPMPATVVVQYARIRPSKYGDKWGNVSPYTESVGRGRALVLRNGKAYDARWSRSSEGKGTTFTMQDGQPMTFARGQVWIVYAPRD